PVERTLAWMNGGISGRASLIETWLRPHESVRPTMMSAATASSGREVLGEFMRSFRRARPYAGHDGEMLLAAMLAHAADLDHRALRPKARTFRRGVQTLCDRA